MQFIPNSNLYEIKKILSLIQINNIELNTLWGHASLFSHLQGWQHKISLVIFKFFDRQDAVSAHNLKKNNNVVIKFIDVLCTTGTIQFVENK